MNPIESKETAAATVDIDSLLQDSYLLVVELLHGAPVKSSEQLTASCIKQVEYVRRQLEQAGLSQRSIDHQGEDHAKWANEPLQARFFNRHQAGEFLYEDMREVLREPAPDPLVLTAFQRVLMLGFKGRYRDLKDPEREQLLAALNACVGPLKLGQTIVTQGKRSSQNAMLVWLRYPLVQGLAAGMLVATVWWGLDQLLSDLIATLVPDQV
jgi:type VI secretion system protein ImpK